MAIPAAPLPMLILVEKLSLHHIIYVIIATQFCSEVCPLVLFFDTVAIHLHTAKFIYVTGHFTW